MSVTRPPRILHALTWVLVLFALTNVIVFCVERFAFTPVRIPSGSMEPTLRTGDRLLVRRTHADVREVADDLRRGDLVVYRAPSAGRPLVVKRVIGLPGETIEARAGIVAVDETTIVEEPWLEGSGRDDAEATQVPFTGVGREQVFVLGDHRASSVDSRAYGPVEISSIVGTVAWRFWPRSRSGRVTR